MQEMQPYWRLCFARIIGTTANFVGGKSVDVRVQDDGRREIRPEVDSRGRNFALLRRNVNANTAAMQLTRPVARLLFFFGAIVTVLAAPVRLR